MNGDIDSSIGRTVLFILVKVSTHLVVVKFHFPENFSTSISRWHPRSDELNPRRT